MAPKKKIPSSLAAAAAHREWTTEEDNMIVLHRSAGREFRRIAKDLGLSAREVRARYGWLVKQPARTSAQ